MGSGEIHVVHDPVVVVERASSPVELAHHEGGCATLIIDKRIYGRRAEDGG